MFALDPGAIILVTLVERFVSREQEKGTAFASKCNQAAMTICFTKHNERTIDFLSLRAPCFLLV